MSESNKYSKAKIYKIVDVNYEKCYIGSTVQPLAGRLGDHKKKFRLFLNQKHHYVTSFVLFEDYGIENCKIELIEEFPCDNVEQLLKREGEHIKANDCVNRCLAGRGSKDYYNDNREKIVEKSRIHYIKNRELINERAKEDYRLNPAKYKERQIRYKDKIHENNTKKGNCPICNKEINFYGIPRHLRTVHRKNDDD